MSDNSKISVVITSFNEPKTIGKAIQKFANQSVKPYEILVISPDKKTIKEAEKYKKIYPFLRVIQDNGSGKPSALNYARKHVNGEIMILSDGDVFASKESISKLIAHFKNKKVGAVTGRPVATNDKKTMLGYWAFLTTTAFHQRRIINTKNNEHFLCSGYLYAIRKNLLPQVPINVLAEDAYISDSITKKGYLIKYEPQAEVFVKYPESLIDWIKQKKRTAARIYQPLNNSKIRKFIEEMIIGFGIIAKVNSLKKIFWFIGLLVMRLYIWFRVFLDYRLWKREFANTWLRVESTK
ncbi:glycosyltransferase [Candidatus Pacearchaeota archaeon]|nr:glycosyltransferase [Candidatus Pacearchaeota archaeon]